MTENLKKYVIKKALEDILKNDNQLNQLVVILDREVERLVRLANNEKVIFKLEKDVICWLTLEEVASYIKKDIDLVKTTKEGLINNNFIKCKISCNDGPMTFRHEFSYYNLQGALITDYHYLDYNEKNIIPFLDLDIEF
jgi:hypothetical protein